jgi:ABC-2 type transport system permease protein
MTTPSATIPAATTPVDPPPLPASADVGRGRLLPPLGALWTLFVLTLRQHVRGKRWMMMGVLFLLPAALAILIRTTAPEAPPIVSEFMLAWMLVPQVLLPLVALLYASGVVQDEQEEQTITYLLVRPIPKWAIYITKLLATLTTTVSLVAVFTAVAYAAIYLGGDTEMAVVRERCLAAIGIHALAVVAYCCLFGLLGLVTTRTLVIGIVYIALVEGLLANMPFGIRLATIIYYTRLIAYRTMSFVVEMPYGRQENLSAEAWQFDLRGDPNLLLHPQHATCLKVLLFGSLVCVVVAAWNCSQREFHVKTPEKD